jgi:hypothetical protein
VILRVLLALTNHRYTSLITIRTFNFIPIFGIFEKKTIEMNKNTSVSLGNYFDEFVQGRVQEGRFKNVSEVKQGDRSAKRNSRRN